MKKGVSYSSCTSPISFSSLNSIKFTDPNTASTYDISGIPAPAFFDVSGFCSFTIKGVSSDFYPFLLTISPVLNAPISSINLNIQDSSKWIFNSTSINAYAAVSSFSLSLPLTVNSIEARGDQNSNSTIQILSVPNGQLLEFSAGSMNDLFQVIFKLLFIIFFFKFVFRFKIPYLENLDGETILRGGVGIDVIEITTKLSNEESYLKIYASTYQCLALRGVTQSSGIIKQVVEETNVVQWSEINVKHYYLYGSQNGDPLTFSIQPISSDENVAINSIGTSPLSFNTIYFTGKFFVFFYHFVYLYSLLSYQVVLRRLSISLESKKMDSTQSLLEVQVDCLKCFVILLYLKNQTQMLLLSLRLQKIIGKQRNKKKIYILFYFFK